MMTLSFLFVALGAFATSAPKPACAVFLWPAAKRVDIAAEYPLRDGRLTPVPTGTGDRVVYRSPWGLSVWSSREFNAWSDLVKETARSGSAARATLMKMAYGGDVEGLSLTAHRRLRSAMVIYREGERIERAIYQSRLIDYGFLKDNLPAEVRAFTGTFGPKFTPEENASLPEISRLILANEASLDVTFSEAPVLRKTMRAEARSLAIPFRANGAIIDLTNEDAIYLARALLRETLLERTRLPLSEDVRLLLGFQPELFPIWPQLESWGIQAHELELKLGDSYFGAPHISLTEDDALHLQLRREDSVVDRLPFREIASASLIVTRKAIRHPIDFEYEDDQVERAIRRIQDEFHRFAPRFGVGGLQLGAPHVEHFGWFVVLTWPPAKVPSAVIIAFYAYLNSQAPGEP